MKKRSHRLEKMARVYDDEILPVWSKRFGRMLLRDLRLPPKAMVLDFGCGTGYPALDILDKMDDQGRIIAIDPVGALLDVARKKTGKLSGRRIFFRSEAAKDKLAFADDVYDLVVSNLTLALVDNPEAMVREFARVTAEGGQVVVTLPLCGTFVEFYDIYREVLTKSDRHDVLERLEAYIERTPDAEQVAGWFEKAGLTHLEVERDEFSLLFKSGREFFFAPVIEFGPLRDWKNIAGKGQEMQDIFWNIKEAIDAYFGSRAFGVTVVAGCFRAVKPEAEEQETDPLVADPESLNDDTTEQDGPVIKDDFRLDEETNV